MYVAMCTRYTRSTFHILNGRVQQVEDISGVMCCLFTYTFERIALAKSECAIRHCSNAAVFICMYYRCVVVVVAVYRTALVERINSMEFTARFLWNLGSVCLCALMCCVFAVCATHSCSGTAPTTELVCVFRCRAPRALWLLSSFRSSSIGSCTPHTNTTTPEPSAMN